MYSDGIMEIESIQRRRSPVPNPSATLVTIYITGSIRTTVLESTISVSEVAVTVAAEQRT